MRQVPLSAWDEDLKDLDLDAFPRAEDFMVEASDVEMLDGAERLSWTNLDYRVPSLDLTVGFPWWEKSRAEMGDWGISDIPRGSVESPYRERDQGCSLLIWQVNDEVFIMDGDGTEGYHDPPVYERWFAVSWELYRAGWQAAIAGFRRG